MFTTLVFWNLYAKPSFYNLFAIALGILVGSLVFFRTPRATLDKWLFSQKRLSKQQFMGLMLIIGWPLPLLIFIDYETASFLLNSNSIFLGTTCWTIVILCFTYTIDSFDEQ